MTGPDILSTVREGDRVDLHLRIPAGLEQFRGHFDGFPMLAGVVQVDWAIRFGQQHFSLAPHFRRLAALKFQRVIGPGCELQLTLACHDAHELNFRYQKDGVTFSSGRALFAD